MSTSNEDAISQSSKKHKAKKHSHFPSNILRRPFYRKSRRNHKTEEINDVGANTVHPGTSSLSGDSHSLSMSSKGDALTIASGQSIPGAISLKSMGRLESQTDPASLECPLCLTTQLSENFPKLMTCQHRSCMDCLRQYLTIEITESRVNLMCPECHERLHPVDMKNILKSSPQLIEKWQEFTLRRCLSVDPDCRWCPAPDCGYAVIAYGCASCPKLHCERPGCETDFCYHCRQEWHPNQTCDAAHLQRRNKLRVQSDSLNYSQMHNINDYIKPCPKCGALIAKMNDGSCNHMTCTVCETEFCWLCLQEITDLHYLSPSGCTFWGKKPWSRKKKILWQIGLLIGAPLGIGLVAGVAIPAIIIGLPIWVARRVIAHFQKKATSSKHRRNTVVVMSVFASIVVSPILAALAVGVGVPVMLMYVYGVVPISLCRTGGYGITARTAANRARNAMRIDIGSPVIPTTTNTNMPEPVPHGGAAHLITNPSIGEASVGGMTMASLSLSHASMEPTDKDGDSASTTAMAGASITGSLSGSVAANAALHNRKDVDQHSTHTQGSVASGNYTSVQVHMADNISDNSVASHFQLSSGPAPKFPSSKSIGAKRKTSKNKMSNSRKSTVPNKIHEHEENKDYGCSSAQMDNDVSQSKIDATNDEIQKAVNEVLRKNEDAASTGSEASSCGSQNALLADDKSTTPVITVQICNEKKNDQPPC